MIYVVLALEGTVNDGLSKMCERPDHRWETTTQERSILNLGNQKR